MRRKPLSWQIPRSRRLPCLVAIAFFSALVDLHSADEAIATAKFLGASACASSGCHGGGKENQFHVWSVRDFHSQRPFATLTTARSKQIGEALEIKNPAADQHCTSCHAPLQNVPESLRGKAFKVSEGVTCESCHGAGHDWLRSHTRPDYSHADRVASGMRDLKNLYVRANTCVACHQTVALPLMKAGHPELIFDLDGQSVSEPKHWREATNWHGAQAWLVGQAAALREMSWQLSQSPEKDARLAARCDALLWLLQKLVQTPEAPAELKALGSELPGNYQTVQAGADRLARQTAEMAWSEKTTTAMLQALANSSADFHQKEVSQPQQARRAERLVLALDRLVADKPRPSPEGRLNELFQLSQSIPDFDPARFATALDKFAKELSN